MSIYIGNAAEDGAQFRQWFIGDLTAWSHSAATTSGDAAALRDTRSVAVKWGVHLKGQARPAGWADGDELVTLSVLVSGNFVISFPEREACLQTPGDYALWAPGVRHTWRADADSVVLTVRFRPG
ncbi:MAG TPA: hypothetical protein VGH20_08465 [Myxococcales bacterium]|jgi:hypothetical protein